MADQQNLFTQDEIDDMIEKALNKDNSSTYTNVDRKPWDEIELEVKPLKKKPRPLCYACWRELSATLDAYYGRDPRGTTHCEPCRRKLKIP